MLRTLKVLSLGISLCTAAACAQLALAQAPAADATAASSPSAPVSFVYVAFTPKNSNGNEIEEYSVAPNGALTPLPGSPYSGNATSLATDGNYLFGPNKSAPYIETYAINSSGELHWVAEENYLQTDPSSGCGEPGDVFLDHTGKSLYLMEYDPDCSENNYYESFAVNPSNGHLSFLGSANGGAASFEGISQVASFLNNNVFAYTATNGCMYNAVWAFKRGSSGALTTWGDSAEQNSSGYRLTPPAPQPGAGGWCYEQTAADPSGHVAIGMQPFTGPSQNMGALQIGSFTADSNGSLTTTNTAASMPATGVTYAQAMSMSPSGMLLAVGGQGGLQVFHFNGASAPTSYTPLLTTDTITAAWWDNSNHLFAISQTSNRLYVFNITPTAYSAAPGSPYTVVDPQSIAVNLIAPAGGGGCSAPSSAGVNLCSPSSGATVNSPVQVTATGTVTGTFSHMELWVDGVKQYSESTSPTLDTLLPLTAGQHRFAVLAVNTSGQSWEQAVNATVQSSGSCSAPGSPGVNLCSPASGATVSSPVQISASANVSGKLSRMELWVDGVEKFSESTSTTLQTSITVAAGTHRFAVLAVNTSGQKWEQAVNATVQ